MATPDYYKKIFLQEQEARIQAEGSADEVIKWAESNYSNDDTDVRYRVAYSYQAAGGRCCFSGCCTGATLAHACPKLQVALVTPMASTARCLAESAQLVHV